MHETESHNILETVLDLQVRGKGYSAARKMSQEKSHFYNE
jgi:hypothetical protein